MMMITMTYICYLHVPLVLQNLFGNLLQMATVCVLFLLQTFPVGFKPAHNYFVSH